MKKYQMFRIGFIVFVVFLFCQNSKAQTAEQEIVAAVNSINQKLAEVKQLAQQKKVYEAMDKLKEAYDEIEHERKWGTFDEKYIEAKKQNPAFSFKINSDLPTQLSSAFWADFESKCDKILANQEVMIKGFKSEITMNNWSKAFAYIKQLKTLYETISGLVENGGSGNLPKLIYDLNGNINDAFDNIIELENAEVEGLEIEAKKQNGISQLQKQKKPKTSTMILHIILKPKNRLLLILMLRLTISIKSNFRA